MMTAIPTFHTHRLGNGLRIIHEAAVSPVVYCGYVVCAGTRHEDEADAGMAHFLEHMSFKGTARRRACHITNGLERVGGDLNAYTSKEETVYYATVLRPDFGRAADLLTDIVFRSTYPQHEIDREVEVICDEIDSYKDSPAELIFDEFEAMLFRGHPLGRDVLGDAGRLRSYRTADARRFADRYYRPANAVFYVLGDVDFAHVVRTMERFTADLPAATVTKPALPLPPYHPEARYVERGTHQAHVVIGARTFGGRDGRRAGLMLLNNILGGPGMNSRLNLSLREHAGLVYSVDAYLSTYPDTGAWNVYFGCDAADVERCRRLVGRELRRLAGTALTPARLAAAKKQLKGQIGIMCEARESYALALGKSYAHYGRHRDIQALCRAIDAVSAPELQGIAAEVYDPEGLTTLVYH